MFNVDDKTNQPQNLKNINPLNDVMKTLENIKLLIYLLNLTKCEFPDSVGLGP